MKAKPLPALNGPEKPDRQGVMRAEWVDPDDIRPTARRTPRMVTGWRGYCPIRKMRGNPANMISEAHVHAADMLREAADVALIGYSGERPMLYVAMTAQPRAGMSKADVARNKAMRNLARALQQFTREQRELIAAVILCNESLNSWCRRKTEETHERHDPVTEKRLLLLILDILAAHFDAEIEDDQRNGRRLAS